MTRPNVELYIEELVLEGFDPAHRHHIGAAVERELTRLFMERGVPSSLAQGGEVPRLDAGQFGMAHGTSPERAGAQIAQSIYGGFGK